jgi:hypothetical protein
MRIFRLAVPERQRGFDGSTERIFVDAICGGAGGAVVDNGADGNVEAALGYVLVNGIVGEAREGVGCFVDVNFGFICAGGFGESKNGIDDSAQFTFGE